MSDSNSDFGAFLAGFVIGGLVGAATALILAPQSGGETRTQIVNKSLELRDVGSERVKQYREMADNVSHDYRDKAEDVLSHTRDRMQEAGSQVQERTRIILDSGKEQASKVRDQVNTYIQKGNGETEGDTTATA